MPRHLALPGHLLIYGVYPELKRLRRTPAVVGWRPYRRRVERRDFSAASLPSRAEHIPLPGGKQRRCHYLSGQTMLMLFRGWILDFHHKNAEEPNLRRRSSSEAREKKKGSVAFFSRRRARFVSRVSLTKSVSPRFPSAAQETKRQGERAGHDRIQALELRQGFPRRQRLGRFGTSSGETVILRSFRGAREIRRSLFFFLFSRLASRPL